MHLMKYTLHLVVTSFLAALATGAEDSAKDPVKSIAPFLDEQVIVVAHVELEDIQVPESLGGFLQAMAMSDEEQKTAAVVATAARTWLEQIRGAGAASVFVVLSIADLPDSGPFMVVTFSREGNPQQIAELLRASAGEVAVIGPALFPIVDYFGGGGVVAGNAQAVARVKAMVRSGRRSAPPAHLATAFKELAGATVKIVLVPNDDHRRVIREMLPSMDWPLEGVSGEMIADGVIWAGVGFDPHQPSIRGLVQSENAVAAARLVGGIDRALNLAARSDFVRQNLSSPREALAMFVPTLEHDRLVWKLESDAAPLANFVEQVVSPPLRTARIAAQRAQRTNQLKQIVLAMHNYHDVNKSFPPHAIRDESGKPLLSWRVAVLPYLEASGLYEQFHLDEPWDSPHNRRLVEQMPKVFADPSLPELARRGVTTIQVPLHDAAAFRAGGEGRPIAEFRDGTSNTILIAEVAHERAVPWTQPVDWEVDSQHPLDGVARSDRPVFAAAYADGSVHTISTEMEPQLFWSLLTVAGDEP